MNDALKISVVICTYNRALYIQDAMESLYSQTLPKEQWEVIVVNNNSIDNTEGVCNTFINLHPDANFYYFNEPQQGSSFARNTGAIMLNHPYSVLWMMTQSRTKIISKGLSIFLNNILMPVD